MTLEPPSEDASQSMVSLPILPVNISCCWQILSECWNVTTASCWTYVKIIFPMSDFKCRFQHSFSLTFWVDLKTFQSCLLLSLRILWRGFTAGVSLCLFFLVKDILALWLSFIRGEFSWFSHHENLFPVSVLSIPFSYILLQREELRFVWGSQEQQRSMLECFRKCERWKTVVRCGVGVTRV